jgi:putative transposase
MIEKNHKSLSVRKQCSVLEINRSTLYYEVVEGLEDTQLTNEIHELWIEMPFYGYRRITAELRRRGYCINEKRVLRLMREMNVQALYPRPKTTIRSVRDRVYPYLLKNLEITRPNQVWATDITYIKMPVGFAYLVALIDVYSRYVVSWRLSNTMDTHFCLEMLNEALCYACPEILNTDQGSQFTSSDWTGHLQDSGILVSMDGKGCWVDNIIIERFWRTLKHEHVLLHSFGDLRQARQSIGEFIRLYNFRRLHQSLGYQTPAEVYGNKAAPVHQIPPKAQFARPDGYVDNLASKLPTYPQAQPQQQPFLN